MRAAGAARGRSLSENKSARTCASATDERLEVKAS